MIRFDDNFRDWDVIGNLTDENANVPGPATEAATPVTPVDPTQAPQAGSGSVSLTTTGAAFTQELQHAVEYGRQHDQHDDTDRLVLYSKSLGGARDNGQYGVDTGGSTTADTYSYGAAGSTDRALGQLRSGTHHHGHRQPVHQ